MHYLFGSDFDGTIAQTFAPSPRGIGVHEACDQACQMVFGKSKGRSLFSKVGGLKNRSPGGLIREIMALDTESVLTKAAKKFFDRRHSNLDFFVPKGKGVELVWDDTNPLPVITELFIREKLEILMSQIGGKGNDRWPKPCSGFFEFSKAISEFNQSSRSSGISLTFGILSSGHDLFIEKCFEMWRLPRPELLLTDDTLRSPACSHLPVEERTKPHPQPFRMLCGDRFKPIQACYAGDDLHMDGGVAGSLEIPFIWFNPKGLQKNGYNGYLVHIKDWRELVRPLLCDKAISGMHRGLPFTDIAQSIF